MFPQLVYHHPSSESKREREKVKMNYGTSIQKVEFI